MSDSLSHRMGPGDLDLLAGPLIYVMGPTASGKSALALTLAEALQGEIVNADSVQVYRGMDIGTAKPTLEERRRVPHHLLDVADPRQPFSAGQFREMALRVIADCRRRRRIPVITGGTGLYFRVLERGLAPTPPVPAALVRLLHEEGERLGWPHLHARLREVDPVFAAAVTPGDSQRITRGLSVYQATGENLTLWQSRKSAPLPFRILKLAPQWPREELYRRIHQRFDLMLEAGLEDEVRALRAAAVPAEAPAMKAVGYRQLLGWLEGRTDFATAVASARQESRRYAKRQITWLRGEEGLCWLPQGDAPRAMALARAFLQGGS
ncbi:MAG: tRNA (adenosine(37)-N6)-dimethylallyltransferase MiaA [Magnetococcus sp. WYHC-3]